MATTRFKGDSGSDRLGVSTISDSDMIQVRHKPGTVDDADKGVSKAVLNSCPFGVSSTDAATAAKTAALTDSNPDFTLLSGREVVVYFSTANSAASPSLNFAGSGANPIYYPDGTAVGDWDAGTWMHLKYFEATIGNTLIQRWIWLVPAVTDAVTNGDKRPVTSNAVYDFPIDSIMSGESRPATSNAVDAAISGIKIEYTTLIANQSITTSYATYTLENSRKLSDYDFISFYVGLYSDNKFYPRGYMRIPSFMFKDESGKIYRIDLPMTGNNNESVSFRYLNDTQIDICLYNTSGMAIKILGEYIG